jgi:hypothetical protein
LSAIVVKVVREIFIVTPFHPWYNVVKNVYKFARGKREERGGNTMRKILVLTFIFCILAGTSFASPMTDYSNGKVAIDISINPSVDITGTDSGGDADWDAKSGNYNIGATFGLGNNIALQINHSQVDTKDYSLYNLTGISGSVGHGELTATEINVLYKTSENVSLFAGVLDVKNDIASNLGFTAKGKSDNGIQLGVIGTTKFNEQTTGYGIVSIGNATRFEVGIGQQITDSLDLNLCYRNAQYKDLEYNDLPGYKYDYKVKGIGFGITYKH